VKRGSPWLARFLPGVSVETYGSYCSIIQFTKKNLIVDEDIIAIKKSSYFSCA
jgi:hypothetical protein